MLIEVGKTAVALWMALLCDWLCWSCGYSSAGASNLPREKKIYTNSASPLERKNTHLIGYPSWFIPPMMHFDWFVDMYVSGNDIPPPFSLKDQKGRNRNPPLIGRAGCNDAADWLKWLPLLSLFYFILNLNTDSCIFFLRSWVGLSGRVHLNAALWQYIKYILPYNIYIY